MTRNHFQDYRLNHILEILRIAFSPGTTVSGFQHDPFSDCAMNAKEILAKHRQEIISLWAEAVFATYPLETTGFLRTKTDPFTNPVAHMTRQAANVLFDALAEEEVDPEEAKRALERFIRLRAVQKFHPSRNLAVLYLMKPILREKVLPEMLENGQLDKYLEMESRLDTLALLAFNLFTEARETLAETRIREIRNQYAQLAKWAQRLEAPQLSDLPLKKADN